MKNCCLLPNVEDMRSGGGLAGGWSCLDQDRAPGNRNTGAADSKDSQPAAASLDTGHSKTAFYINYFCQTFGWAAQEKFKLTANSIAGQRYKNPTFKVTKFFALTRKLFNITITTTDK